MAYKLSPVANLQQFFDNLGNPLSGGKLFTYIGTSYSIMAATSSDAGYTPNANPIVLDSSGRVTTPIWLVIGSEYRFMLTKADGTTVLQTTDGIIV